MLKLFPAALVATLILLGTAREGQAQWVDSTGFDAGFVQYGDTMMPSEGSDFAPPYSYFAAFPGPARIYVPYNDQDTFTFQGQPYGRPYDRWSWNYLTGSYGAPARYFYPPLR